MLRGLSRRCAALFRSVTKTRRTININNRTYRKTTPSAAATTNQNLESLPNERSFRLLKLYVSDIPELKLPKDYGPLLAFTTHVFSLDDPPQYVALSYTWGEPRRQDVTLSEEDDPGSSEDPADPVPVGEGSFPRYYRDTEDDQPGFKFYEGNERHPITKNLQAAMKHLYLAGYADVYLWMDAICIDQNNMEEKQTQVALMDEVYSKANHVVVWLGEDKGDFADFKWLHEEFLPALGVYFMEDGGGYEALKRINPLDPVFTNKLGIQPPNGNWRECWANFFDFGRRNRWFSRAWIVQEVALARNCVILYGRQRLSWELVELFGLLMVLTQWSVHVGKSVKDAFGRAAGDHTARLQLVKQNFQTQLKRAHSEEDEMAKRQQWFGYLQMLLLETRPYLSSNPRDKVFGFWGLAKKALPPGMEPPIKPDYASKPQSVFTGVAGMLLNELRNLSNLSHVDYKADNRLKDLPSWVPDYTASLNPQPFIHLRAAEHEFECCTSTTPNYVPPHIDGDILEVQGVQFDTVAELATPMWELIKTQDPFSALRLCTKLDAKYSRRYNGSGEILWRTMIADTIEGTPAPPALADSFRDWVTARLIGQFTPLPLQQDESGRVRMIIELDDTLVEEIRSQLAILDTLRASSPDPVTSPIPTIDAVLQKCRLMHHFSLTNFVAAHSNLAEYDDALPTLEEQMIRIEGQSGDFRRALGPTLPFRRLYRTERGFLGLGPEGSRKGDGVWILRGAKVPFVMREGGRDGRREKNEYGLIGETYLHGYMNGEMARTVKEKVGRVRIV